MVVLKSWKAIGDRHGEEAVDVMENMFVHLCRFATHDAIAEARLSHVVFAAYWDAPARHRGPIDVFTRWFPMELKAPTALIPIDAAWFPFEVSAGESSRDVFDRVAAQVDEEALPRGWDGQVG